MKTAAYVKLGTHIYICRNNQNNLFRNFKWCIHLVFNRSMTESTWLEVEDRKILIMRFTHLRSFDEIYLAYHITTYIQVASIVAYFSEVMYLTDYRNDWYHTNRIHNYLILLVLLQN